MNNINFDLEIKKKHTKKIKQRERNKKNKRKLLANMIALSLGDDLFPGSSRKKKCDVYIFLLLVFVDRVYCFSCK